MTDSPNIINLRAASRLGIHAQGKDDAPCLRSRATLAAGTPIAATALATRRTPKCRPGPAYDGLAVEHEALGPQLWRN
jgi:hypothetical protein